MIIKEGFHLLPSKFHPKRYTKLTKLRRGGGGGIKKTPIKRGRGKGGNRGRM